MFQRGKLRFNVFTRFFPRLVGGKLLHEKIGQLVDRGVDEFAVSIAPFTVFLVESAVRFPTYRVVVERHSATLAEKLSRTSEQCIDGYLV